MSKKANQTNRKKGSDKRKNTLNKYGKNTTRGLRIKQIDLENEAKNLKIRRHTHTPQVNVRKRGDKKSGRNKLVQTKTKIKIK